MLKFTVGDKVIVNERAGAAWAGSKGIVACISCYNSPLKTRALYQISGISDPYFYSYELDLLKKKG